MSDAVVLLSGGMDSLVALAWAKRRYQGLVCVSFDYGQRHRVELECAKELSAELGVEHAVLPMTVADSTSYLKGGSASPVVEGRNLIMLTMAASVAKARGAGSVVAGYCLDDAAGFPDCRPSFVAKAQEVLRLALDFPVSVERPLISKTKAEIFALAESLGVLDLVLEKTHTCYRGDRSTAHVWGYGCGECSSCKTRANGWEQYEFHNHKRDSL